MDDNKRLEFLRGLEKLKASGIKAEDYSSPLEQDVMKVAGGKSAPEAITKLKGMTEKIDTKGIAPVISGSDFADKISKLRALKAAGKKVAGILPFAGAGMAALSGDPAMAAEELAQDVAGPLGEVVKSDSAGMSPEEEKMMLQEDRARKSYQKSPSRLDRLRRILAGEE